VGRKEETINKDIPKTNGEDSYEHMRGEEKTMNINLAQPVLDPNGQ
jgi:hypothetical protein